MTKNKLLLHFLNANISDKCGMRAGREVPGDLFGLELECEGRKVDLQGIDLDDLSRMWQMHVDGSLRNHHGSSAEWVFRGPVGYDAALKRVDALFEAFKANGARLVCSNRTSLHVHYNMSDKAVYQLFNLFIVFTMLEDILDSYCGEDRRGNLFCLSSRYAEHQVMMLTETLELGRLAFGNDFRYASFNLAALNKFGTVEFRAMRGLDNAEDVKKWLTILKRLTDFGVYQVKNPVDLINNVSVDTPVGFVRTVFGDLTDELTKNWAEDDLTRSVYDGLRLVQPLAHKIADQFSGIRLRGKDFWASFAPEPPTREADEDMRVDFAEAPGARGAGHWNAFIEQQLFNEARQRAVRANPFQQRPVFRGVVNND